MLGVFINTDCFFVCAKTQKLKNEKKRQLLSYFFVLYFWPLYFACGIPPPPPSLFFLHSKKGKEAILTARTIILIAYNPSEWRQLIAVFTRCWILGYGIFSVLFAGRRSTTLIAALGTANSPGFYCHCSRRSLASPFAIDFMDLPLLLLLFVAAVLPFVVLCIRVCSAPRHHNPDKVSRTLYYPFNY